jgi:tetratricopeptide (TPR) repeat protein
LKGVASWKLKNYEGAIEDIKEAIKLSPQDKKIRNELELVKAEKKKHISGQAAAMAQFFKEE